ncbi:MULTISPECIES: FdhF/YdeP family oxidoreductase [Micrococcaceae]|uniref:FdhF/YdeP family oxidoreductase n=1 Tax=unclassified Kocuria TaxID=2649579 RepID=UPI00101111AE|nr:MULTISPECIES: FdhF/YdeP family oxidoreductase [unclassified Kocuria]
MTVHPHIKGQSDETASAPGKNKGPLNNSYLQGLAGQLVTEWNVEGGQGQGGYGPRTRRPFSQKDYHHPAAGYGAALSVTEVLAKEREPVLGARSVFTMNQTDGGFDCPGCAWPDDPNVSMDICENGIKHVTWEMTPKRTTREFFAQHSVTELESWTDHDLEKVGRLTEPMSYDAESDHYIPITWENAFAMVGDTLRGLDSPHEATFYTSGRLSNEATFMYQLWAREFGTNNLPDCSNMCHEASGRALTASLGTGKGTADLNDWLEADLLFVMGVNAGSNAPRMLTALAQAERKGTKIVHINPIIEGATNGTIVPHEIDQMMMAKVTRTSSLNLQVRPGGDMALMRGIGKRLIEFTANDPEAIDQAFLEKYTHDFEAYRRLVEQTSWEEIEEQSGVSKGQIMQLANLYRESDKTLISWCLGVSQHEHGVDTVREIVNLLMLRGNLGKNGVGPSPVRGHSNVQGNRTCGIDHRPSKEFIEKLNRAFNLDAPTEHGLDTVSSIEAMHEGSVKVFVSLGGNFVRAVPDPEYTETAMRKLDLNVQVSTKLNRSHIVHGKKSLILPCLGRSEKDVQASGEQCVSAEDAMSMVHASFGMKKPASPHLLSEMAILGGMARATLPESTTPFEKYVDNYDEIRDMMTEVLPGFENFNERVRQPAGFRIYQAARELDFSKTTSGKANFSTAELPQVDPGEGKLVLQTMRSHDQWNTTIYSNNDRYRGIKNIRTLVFMNPDDMRARGIQEGDFVSITSTSKLGIMRRLNKYRAFAKDIPQGSAAGYMPEMNVLIGIEDYSTQSEQPLMKSIRVTIELEK